MEITFGLLGLAIFAVWLNPIQVRKQFSVQPWLFLFLGACISALLMGYVKPIAIIALSLFASSAYLATRSKAGRFQKMAFSTFTALIALALAMHKVPGFNNPAILSNIQLSAEAPPFTQYANFDKGVVGLILLAFFCKRTTKVSDLLEILKRVSPIAVITITCVIATALAIGFVRPEFKLSWATPVFLATNLLFTVVAEESFFRGFLQNHMATSLQRFRFGAHISVVISAVLFGIAHIGGGASYFFIAMIGGFGYAYAFFVSRRIEAPILIHFALNAVHFIGFTYPYLRF